MGVFFDMSDLPEFRASSITIGTFDGVHKGHEVILNQVVDRAESSGGDSIVVTFEPHPRKLLFPEKPLKLITPLDEKIDLIRRSGIRHIVVAPFTQEFSKLSAEEYIQDFLVKNFHPRNIIIGYDHRFGHDRTGDISLLIRMESRFDFRVLEIPPQLIDAAAVSSTKIRAAILSGRVEDAAEMLGRPFSWKGKVIRGKKLGRTLGFPTANLEAIHPEQLLPETGIYAVQVRVDGGGRGGMMSIGVNPTVSEENRRSVEVHIFDFNKEIYDDVLEVKFLAFLRAEEKFCTLDDLKRQLFDDQEAALRIIRNSS